MWIGWVRLSATGICGVNAEIARSTRPGTTIGMNSIKRRRLNELTLTSHPELHVGQCVPFYFCPRSIMLFLIHRANHAELSYRGGQAPIIHLEADLSTVVSWANENNLRWAFTLSNAGACYFEDRNNLAQLSELDWDAIRARDWQGKKESKQAEFLIEKCFPWHLVERIGVMNNTVCTQVRQALAGAVHRPPVEVKRNWYY